MNILLNYKKHLLNLSSIPLIGQLTQLQIIQLHVRLGRIADARQQLLAIARAQPTEIHTVYTDLSVISMNDAGTGIQRLVKSVWNRLDHPDIRFVPIYATRKKKYAYSQYPQKNIKKRQYVALKTGDLFFGLDWSADQIIRHQKQLYQWKKNGAKFVFILNDILALHHPEWFTTKNRAKLSAWLKVISVCANEIVCVSHYVQQQVEQWLKEQGIDDLPCSSIKLGGEIDPRAHVENIRANFKAQYLSHSYILKVSTLEPRKGHLCLVKAFEALLKQYPDYPHNLYLVGRYGWHAEEVVAYIQNSVYFNRRIFWFDDINDEELKTLYQHAAGVVNASYGEGFGLPLMEAISYQKPLLVRDLAVFHEVTSHQAEYFQKDTPQDLAQTLYNWSKALNADTQHVIPIHSWDQTTVQLMDVFKRHGVH